MVTFRACTCLLITTTRQHDKEKGQVKMTLPVEWSGWQKECVGGCCHRELGWEVSERGRIGHQWRVHGLPILLVNQFPNACKLKVQRDIFMCLLKSHNVTYRVITIAGFHGRSAWL